MTTPVYPSSNKRNVLITSALPYVNNVPHLGNIIGAVLSADVFARYCRNKGYNTLFVCGTDEYGTATETKALEEGLTCQQICDKYHAIHKAVYEWFLCDFDHFGRTTRPAQKPIAQDLFINLYKKGLLTEQVSQQPYCPIMKKFLADRYIVGTCPHCGFPDARGDQCDGCQKLINSPMDLINPKSKFSNATPIIKETKHLYFDLGQVQPSLEKWFEDKTGDILVKEEQTEENKPSAAENNTQGSLKNDWTPVAMNITKSWFKSGLAPRCITRDLEWGTPVPTIDSYLEEFYKSKVFYVWFDAPIGYISITADYFQQKGKDEEEKQNGWKKWWKITEDDKKNGVQKELVQFMGKDNVTFHSIIFPSTLIADSPSYPSKKPDFVPDQSKGDWVTVDSLCSTEYLNYENGKFSKSRGTGVFGDQARDTGIIADAWRYYLISIRPEMTDSQFSWDDFQAKNNSELLNNLGNLIQRAISFSFSNFNQAVPVLNEFYKKAIEALNAGENKDEKFIREQKLIEEINNETAKIEQCLEKKKLKESVQRMMIISKMCNQYYQDRAPWALIPKKPKKGEENKEVSAEEIRQADEKLEEAKFIAFMGIELCYHLSLLLEPYMPNIYKKITTYLGYPETKKANFPENAKINLLAVEEGQKLVAPIPLFTKLEDETIKKWKLQFGEKEPFRADLRAGTIESVEPIEGNDKLWYLKVNFGEKIGHRNVVAGIKSAYSDPNTLKNRKVLAITNLPEVELSGKTSQAMLLVGKTKKEMVLLGFDNEKEIENGFQVVPHSLKTNISDKSLSTTDLKELLKYFKYDTQENKCIFKSFDVPHIILSGPVTDKKIQIC